MNHNKIVISTEKVTDCTGLSNQGVGEQLRGGLGEERLLGTVSSKGPCRAQLSSAAMIPAPLCLAKGITAQAERAGMKRVRNSTGNTKVVSEGGVPDTRAGVLLQPNGEDHGRADIHTAAILEQVDIIS